MKKFLCLSLFIHASISSMKAQSARDSVVVAVNRLFEGMKKGDTLLLKDCFSDNAVLQTIQADKGMVKVMEEKIEDFIGFVGKQPSGAADEQIIVESVIIDGLWQ